VKTGFGLPLFGYRKPRAGSRTGEQ